jgi:hypothetical protein
VGKLVNLSFVSAFFLTYLMTACVTAPPRSSQSAFKLIQEGRISVKNTQAFTDCLMDGFDEASFVLTTAGVRQQRRVEGYRVEVITNSAVLISADVSDAGYVKLFESEVAALIPTTEERNVFAECLKRFQSVN